MKDLVMELYKKFESAAEPFRFPRFYSMTKAELYWRGQQLIFYNADAFRWDQMDPDDVDLYYVDNIFNPFVEQVASEASDSKPKLVTYSEVGDDEHVTQAVSESQYLADALSGSMTTEQEMERENRLCVLRGTVLCYTYFDSTCGPDEEVPVFGPVQAQVGETPVEMEGVTGTKKQKAGKIRSIPVDLLEVEIWDRANTVEESPYVRWDHMELIHKLKRKYPWHRIGKDIVDSSKRAMNGLYFKRQLETAAGNTGEADANQSNWSGVSVTTGQLLTDELTARETLLFYDVDLYAGRVAEKDEPLPGTNYTLPAGTKYDDVFPAGMMVCLVNGEPAAYYNVNKNDRWTGYCNQTPPTGFFGVGAENELAKQDWYNENGSLIQAAMVNQANGITVADERVQGAQMLNKPGFVGRVKDRMPNENIGNFLAHYQTQGLDPSVMAWRESIKENMQLGVGARASGISGEPGPGMDTATGVKYQNAVMNRRSAPRLKMRATALARRMEQAIKIFQQRQMKPAYFTKFGETRGKWLSAFDIGTDIKVRVEADSYQARSTVETREDTVAALKLGWGSAMPAITPDAQDHIGKIFQMPQGGDRKDDWHALGQERLDMLNQMEQMAGQAVSLQGADPNQAQMFAQQQVGQILQSPEMFNPKMDNHAVLAQFYRDHYLSDAYRKSSPIYQQAVEMLVDMHEGTLTIQAQKQTADMIESQAPALQLQESQRQQARQEQKDDAEDQGMAEHDKEMEGREHEDEQSDKKMMHEANLARMKEKGRK